MLAVYLASVKTIIITVLKQVGGKIDYISVSTITYTEREATQPGQMEPGEDISVVNNFFQICSPTFIVEHPNL